MPLARTHTSLDYDDYGLLSSSLWVPDLNRSVYTTPSGCSMSYRMNMTIHDPAVFENSYYSERKKGRSRLSRALKELWNRGSRKDLSKSMYAAETREHQSPKKRRGVSMVPTTTRTTSNYNNYVAVPVFSTPPTRQHFRAYNRAPSADAATMLFQEDNRRPIRIQSFAMPEPRVVQFRQPRLKKSNKYAFVNSHEWTLSRHIRELRLGIVGTARSCKNSLIHRYLTGQYNPEESPEGGRFKKEVVIDGESHLLLIRDEGHRVHQDQIEQFTLWADAIVFVFSTTDQDSLQQLPAFRDSMAKYRNLAEMPMILVGTKDNEPNERYMKQQVYEEEAKKMAQRLKCVGYEFTDSRLGLNVDKIFKEVVSRISQLQSRSPTPHTPARSQRHPSSDSQNYMASANVMHSKGGPYQRSSSYVPLQETNGATATTRRSHVNHREQNSEMRRPREERVVPMRLPDTYGYSGRSSQQISPSSSRQSLSSVNGWNTRSSTAVLETAEAAQGLGGAQCYEAAGGLSAASASTSHLPTPSSTPTNPRKNKRISNFFRTKDNEKAIESKNHGVGRAIPIKQGHLYKRSTKSALNRDWKKKYVCLYSDGRLTYHHNLKDYMDKPSEGKEVFLGLCTVKTAGRQRPRNTQRMAMSQTEESTPTQIAVDRRSDIGVIGSGEGTSGGGSDDAKESNINMTPQTAPGKKRRPTHKRIGSSGKQNEEDEECFEIVTHDQKKWEFCASSAEERAQWVAAIEEQIERALQGQPSNRIQLNREEVQALKQIPGNMKCADCATPNPDWASLNLGTLICIECSGVHRNMGSHVSKVRSLELDDWPVEYLAVMQTIGNDVANRMWEHHAPLEKKPTPESPRESKETWIRSKYELKRWLPSPRVDETFSSQLVKAVISRDVQTACLILARATPEDVNACVAPPKDKRTPLHLACSNGSLEMVQLLLWNNCDPLALDEQGRSALWYAHHQGCQECAQVLITAGVAPDYGMAPNQHIQDISELAVMGSLSNRSNEYSYLADDVVFRRQSMPVGGPGPAAINNKHYSRQAQDFDQLPDSVI